MAITSVDQYVTAHKEKENNVCLNILKQFIENAKVVRSSAIPRNEPETSHEGGYADEYEED